MHLGKNTTPQLVMLECTFKSRAVYGRGWKTPKNWAMSPVRPALNRERGVVTQRKT